MQGNQTTASIASPVLPSPSLLDHDALPNLDAALDSPSFDTADPVPQEIEADRGRFPAQRRKRRNKAEIAAARAGSTESSRVALARDEAVAGLTKLQQVKASESSQGENAAAIVPGPSTSAAAPSQISKPVTQSSPPAPVPPTPPNTQVPSTAPSIPPIATATAPPPPAGRTDPTVVDVAMQDALRAFHYPNPGAASQPVRPYRPYRPHAAEHPQNIAGAQVTTAPVPQPLSAHTPNPNLAHLSYTTPQHQSNPVYAPYPPIPTSAAPATRNTVWPETSRAAIAAAARDALMADPQNAGKSISAEEIIGMLEKQPNYVDLCEIFERQYGFVLDRRRFAHLILQAVPPGPGKSAANGMNGNKVTQKQQQAAPTANMGSAINGSSRRQSTAKGKKRETLSPPVEAKDLVATPPAEQGPVTKAEMARKRTFADLVDLTADSDEEDRIKRVKLAQLTNGKGPEAGSSSRDPSRVRDEDVPHHPLLAPAAPKEPEKLDMSNLKNFTLSAAREALRTAEIAQPIDPSKAKPAGKYNIKTLARDILITAGKHETEAPLNFHLFGLKDIYKHVNQTTDLSSLRWDIMDPGGPEPGTGLEDVQNGSDKLDRGGEKVDAEVVARLGGKGKAKVKKIQIANESHAQSKSLKLFRESILIKLAAGDDGQARLGEKSRARVEAGAMDTETEDDSTAAQTFEPGM